MSLPWKWTVGIALVLFIGAFVGLSLMAGSPRDAYGMARSALPHMHRGKLKVGDDAPDARLVGLDGSDRFHIRERTGSRPLVLVFVALLDPHFVARSAISRKFITITKRMPTS